MQFFTLVRSHVQTGAQQVCTGSSPINRTPYWTTLGDEPVTQPLLFRDEAYAKWCVEIAQRDDPEAALYTYSVGPATVGWK